MSRGRPKENDEPLLKYTQVFENPDGSKATWVWDKTIHRNGPISVEFEEYISPELKKLIKERNDIVAKYDTPEGERKKRITKIDKARLEELDGKIEKIQI